MRKRERQLVMDVMDPSLVVALSERGRARKGSF